MDLLPGCCARIIDCRATLQALVEEQADICWTPTCEKLVGATGIVDRLDHDDRTGVLREIVILKSGECTNLPCQWLPLAALSAVPAEQAPMISSRIEEHINNEIRRKELAKQLEEEKTCAKRKAQEEEQLALIQTSRRQDADWAVSCGQMFPLQLIASSVSGDTFNVDVPSLSVTFEEVRKEIAEQAGKDIRQICLLLDGEPLPQSGELRQAADALARTTCMQVCFQKIRVHAGVIKRLQKELRDIETRDEGRALLSSVELVDPDVYEELSDTLRVTLRGPQGTPYENGLFEVRMRFSDRYPFEAPKCHFTTQIWNPNIHPVTGRIDLDILHDQWSPAMSLLNLCWGMEALFTYPSDEGCGNAEAYSQLRRDKTAFENTAREWTQLYARPKACVDR
eukprot:TRINITY_DN59164_c0_g1_i1.p1 TRINITY_DN59164_c0_g1~~TRINITY_DN59164_c0_g1_i1.p1  ORF type:complete len:408 (-),score=41.49 TRINITY_DN59164_c0_g1_i1:494-1681(-)